MNFFFYESKFKIEKKFGGGGGDGGRGGGTRLSKFILQKIQI